MIMGNNNEEENHLIDDNNDNNDTQKQNKDKNDIAEMFGYTPDSAPDFMNKYPSSGLLNSSK